MPWLICLVKKVHICMAAETESEEDKVLLDSFGGLYESVELWDEENGKWGGAISSVSSVQAAFC